MASTSAAGLAAPVRQPEPVARETPTVVPDVATRLATAARTRLCCSPDPLVFGAPWNGPVSVTTCPLAPTSTTRAPSGTVIVAPSASSAPTFTSVAEDSTTTNVSAPAAAATRQQAIVRPASSNLEDIRPPQSPTGYRRRPMLARIRAPTG